MANIRDHERDMYIYHARKVGKRLLADIGLELGISRERVRQVYRRMDWAINRENADHCIKAAKREAKAKAGD